MDGLLEWVDVGFGLRGFACRDDGTLEARAARINTQGQQSPFAQSEQSSKHLEQ